MEFNEEEPPENIKKIFNELVNFGIECHYGTWMKHANPKTILIDPSGFMSERDRIKTELWENYGVDSINVDFEYDEPVVWSYAAGMLIEEIIKDKCGVAHFHEWMAGAGLLYLENLKKGDGNGNGNGNGNGGDNDLKIATVFTTHATMLGRSMAGSGLNLHEKIESELANGETATNDSARRYGVAGKHTLEKACAHNANVFTTVSETTARECEYIHGKKPDIVLPNGLDIEKFPHTDELSISRKDYWRKMKSFLTAYFSRYYDVDFSSSRVVYISGRYEFHNKGIDLFIRALGKLNEKFKKDGHENKEIYPVAAFIWIPTGIRGVNMQVLENVTLYGKLGVHAAEIIPEIEKEIIKSWAHGKIPRNLSNNNLLKISKKVIAHFKNLRGSTPRLCAFNLSYDEQNDMILNSLKENGLFNRKEDIVKVIFYPVYLSSDDGLLDLDYLNATIPCSLGVFPSYYEPWGYTPLEAAAWGIPAVTTDLAGFGKFIKDKNGKNGIYVLEMDKTKEKVVDELMEIIYENVTMPTNELVDIRIKAKELAALCDWKILIRYYLEAHKLAMEKIK